MTTLRPSAGSAGTYSSPFENGHADPWAKSFIDLPELNARVTDAIGDAIKKVRTAARQEDVELRTSSLLVLGPAGAGKTHLFMRLRHKLGPRAVFVHLRPLVGTEMTPRYVLGQIVRQLKYESTTNDGGLTQLEALVGASLAQLEGAPPEYPRLFLDEVRALDDAAREEKLEAAAELLLDRHQEVDETYLARLLAAPFMKSGPQRAALAWLAGEELEESQMRRLGVNASLPEERVIRALQTLGLFAAPGAPIVLVFDQLENLLDAEQSGSRVRAYANLVAELFDGTRGYVLVQMALESEWQATVLPELTEAQRSRLGGHTTVIALPTPNERRELVKRWVEHIPDRAEAFPWPFGEARIAHWTTSPGMTPRMLMIECKQALALGPNAPFTPPEHEEEEAPLTERPAADPSNDDATLAAAWESHLRAAREALDEASADRRSADPARIVGGMACALRFAKDVQTSRVDARQYVQLLARVGGEAGPCALAFLHQTHPRSVSTALDRAADTMAKGRVVVVRERALEFAPTWRKIQTTLSTLLAKGLRWVTLERTDATQLLALESFLAAAKSGDVEDALGRSLELEAVHGWIGRTLDVASWPIVGAVLGERGEHDGDAPVDASVDRGSNKSLVPPSLPPSSRRTKRTSDRTSETAATIRTCLTQLRIASLERLVREVARVEPTTSRTDVLATLDGMASDIRWFGRAIVAMNDAANGASTTSGESAPNDGRSPPRAGRVAEGAGR